MCSELLWVVGAGHVLPPDATQGRTFTPPGVERLIPAGYQIAAI